MSSCLFECLKEAGLERYYSTLQRRGYDTAFSLLYLPPAELQDVGIATDSDRQRFLQLVQIIASFHQGGELSPRRVSSPHRSSVKIKPISGRKNTQNRAQMTNSRRPDSHSSDSSHSSSVSEESPPGYVLSSRRKPRTNFGHIPTTGTAIAKRKSMPIPVPILPMKHMHNAEERVRSSSNQRGEQTTHAFDVYQDLSQGDDFTNVAQPIGVPPPVVAIPMTPNFLAAEDSDDVTYATRNIRMSAESLKVQKVMRTKEYNYGLPRDGHQQNGVNGLIPRMQRKIVTRNSIPASDSTKASGSQNSRDSPNSPQARRRRITVCVRKRPILKTECQVGGFDVVTCNREDSGKDGGLVVHELKHTVDMAEFIQQNVFQFDKVFIELSTNHDIYESAVKPMVDWIMTQTNRATCFGYGQTGAGKTHTLLGNDTEWGVFFHAAKDILSRLGTQHGRTNRGKGGFSLSISLYEIYCSRIFDLLNDHKRLQALEDSKKQIHIYGLKSVQVQDMETLQEVVRQGLGARSVGVTGANQDSSRSHAIVQLSVKDANGAEFSRLSFIDLAGSERACDALRDSDKQNRLEGAEINQSLLALKECIRSLDLALAHTPFRQSKLTQVLRDSFIGNSKTCMIANISPSHTSMEHTMNTLRYASRVKELHKKPGYSTPRHQRNRSATVSSRSAQRRPLTADPTYSQSRPGVSASPKIQRHISRSVSIDSSTRVMDYTTAFTGQGRELARTPPPINTSSIAEEANAVAPEQSTEVLQERLIILKNSESTPMHSRGSSGSGAESRSLPIRKTRSIFTPEAIGASSTPNKKTDSVEVNLKPLKVLKEMSANETQTSTSTPASTPRFLNDTELVGGLSINPAVEPTKKKASTAVSIANEATTSASNDNLSSGKERTETFSNSSSVAAEHGSLKGENTSSSRTSKSANTNSISGTSMRSGSDGPMISAEETQPPNISETRTDSNRSRRSSKASITSNDSDNLGSIEDTPQGAGLPESTNNPGLPSPKKFLTYLKDKHSIRTKALKQQLRKAGRRAKQDSQGSEEEALSSDFSASSSSANAVSYLTSRDNLTSNVQQHHQQLSSQSESLPQPTPITITNAPTPPRLPSPKLDRSEPRRSSRVSSRSSSPAGRITPDERRSSTSSVPNPSTMTGLTSASELHARLAAAAAMNSHSDSDDAKMSGSEMQLPSTSWKQTIAKASRKSSSSDKENKDVSSKKDEYIQRAQSEVIIAHQEHISEILRISIEEERLYHELRDQWSKGKPFDAYTKSLQKLLARKTQSIEALKLQLALYDRVCNAPG